MLRLRENRIGWVLNSKDVVQNNTFTGNNISSPSGSFQTRWDTFLRLAQPLLSHIPVIPNAGAVPPRLLPSFSCSLQGLDSSYWKADIVVEPALGHVQT